MAEAMMMKMMRRLVFYQLLSNWDSQFGRTRMIMYLCIYDIFGPENPCLLAFGSRSMRFLGVHTQIFSQLWWGKWPFLQKVCFCLKKE